MFQYSNREEDIEHEKKLYKFLDEIYKENGIIFERNEEATLQKHGIDGFAKYKNSNNVMFIDEKAATKYWDRDLPTFAFELFSNKMYHGELTMLPGWFNPCNDFVKTTHYSLIWVRSKDSNLDKIQSIEVCIVSKEDLWKYISCFFDGNANDMYNNVKDELPYFGICRKDITNDLKIVWSVKILPEQPICVTVKKEVLIKLSIFHTKKVFNMEE